MKYLKILGWLALPATIAVFVFALPRVMKITSIVCKSQYGPCSEGLAYKLASLQGQSLSAVKKSLKLVLGSEPAISNYSFQLKLPPSLEVNLVEDKALFALTASDKKHFFLVDNGGVVVRIQDNSNLPLVILGENPPNVGEKVNPKSLFALQTVSDLYRLYQIKEGRLVNDSLETYLPSGQKVIFPLEGDRELLVGSLALIISRLNQADKDSNIKVSVIDLRFKNPVLR